MTVQTLKVEAKAFMSHGENLGFAIEAGDSAASFTLMVSERVRGQPNLVEA